jgi:ABC-type sulfate transport system permease component
VDDKFVKFYGAHWKIMLMYANLFIVVLCPFIYIGNKQISSTRKSNFWLEDADVIMMDEIKESIYTAVLSLAGCRFKY